MSILDRDLSECRTFSEISEWRAEKYKIDDLRERIRNGSVRAVPGVIYYE
jgi:hypothetical protein